MQPSGASSRAEPGHGSGHPEPPSHAGGSSLDPQPPAPGLSYWAPSGSQGTGLFLPGLPWHCLPLGAQAHSLSPSWGSGHRGSLCPWWEAPGLTCLLGTVAVGGLTACQSRTSGSVPGKGGWPQHPRGTAESPAPTPRGEGKGQGPRLCASPAPSRGNSHLGTFLGLKGPWETSSGHKIG